MKKILIFSLTYYPDLVGGDAVAIREITDRIDPSDIEFHMVTLRFDSRLPAYELIGHVHIHRIGLFTKEAPDIGLLQKLPLKLNKHYFQVAAAIKGLWLHRTLHFDGIWAMMAHSAGNPAALFKLCHPKVGYLLTLQEGDPPEYIERLMRPVWLLFRRSFRSADVVQVISNFLGDWARRMGFSGHLFVVPNGASVSADTISEEEKRELMHAVGKEKGDIFLINVSRLVHKNAVDDCIRALVYLPAHIKLLAVGGGPDEEMLRALTEELSLQDRVIFTGQVDRQMTAKYRAISDIFIRPSRSEGMGNSFASAMASRIPIIATQEGGLADFIFDVKRNPDKETTAWVVDKDSPEQIAEAVRDILAHPEQVQKVVDTCHRLVTTTYNWNHIARTMRTDVFGRILG